MVSPAGAVQATVWSVVAFIPWATNTCTEAMGPTSGAAVRSMSSSERALPLLPQPAASASTNTRRIILVIDRASRRRRRDPWRCS
jgi:hypothetical protein